MARHGGATATRRTPVILGIETSCDETCAAVVRGRRHGAVEHRRLPGRVPRAVRRRGAGDRLAAAPGARRPRGARRRWATPARRSRDVERIAVTAGPGLVGALLVGVSAAKAYAYAAASRSCRSTTCTATSRRCSLRPRRVEPPLLVLLASGGHTLLLRVRRPRRARRCSAAPGRRRRRGLRQGRAPARPRLPRRPRDRAAAARRRSRRRIALPTPMAGRGGHDLSFSGLKTALLHRV